jgi:uracil phosphoribosyltransferase
MPNHDQQYQKLSYALSQREHKYGERVSLVSDPFLITRLARLCSSGCQQPEINRLIRETYRTLGQQLANAVFPRTRVEIPTRMAKEHPKEAVFSGEIISPTTKVVILDLARAGILPSMELFDLYTSFIEHGFVRVDHVFINRSVGADQHVTGAAIHGSKIGGSVEGAYVIVPDPMGATGSSFNNVVDLYKKNVPGTAKAWISLNLIVTPEYVRNVQAVHPHVRIITVRLDRAFSSTHALESAPGEHPKDEKGLNDHDYIVPGGGGFGEISNNSFV